MFNFNAPNFIFRFALGETDYQLGVTNYEHFASEYNYLGRDVWQQTLNLTQAEKEHLFNLLQENYRPENRIYRYNFFYDNCATRPRDQIETDYQLGVTNYEHFASEYNYLGRDVWQQTLNLTQAEKEHLFNLLQENYRPENRIYRYNFFYDNCATRPRDQIEAAIDGTLQYADNMTDTDTGVTFRDLLHKYSEGHPWSRFGMDLCMGSKADQPINRRLMMFVPFYVQDFFNTARIVDNEGQARPLVSSEEKIVVTGLTDADHRSGGITPMQSALLLFVLVAAATIYGIRRGKTLWGLDLILFFCAGIAGCILAFLALFSQHPAVSPNYLLFVFHPLHLFCLPWMINKVRKRQKSWYMRTNCAVLTLFILLWAIIPQRIDLAVLPLALCLLVRSASNLILTLKKR